VVLGGGGLGLTDGPHQGVAATAQPPAGAAREESGGKPGERGRGGELGRGVGELGREAPTQEREGEGQAALGGAGWAARPDGPQGEGKGFTIFPI
jgi:hypothetical protein